MVEALTQTPIEASVKNPDTGILIDSFIFSPNDRVTKIFNPENALPYRGLRFHKNGVDLKVANQSRDIRYEDKSFEMMLEETKEGLWIGPHLIDFIYNGGRYGLSGSRPDGIQLVSNGVVKINRLMEAKSGPAEESDVSIPKKISNLEKMLEQLRENPNLLPLALRKAIGRYFEMPEEIHVPPTSRIKLTFVTGQQREPGDSYPFPVDFRRLEIPEIAA